MCIRPMLLLFSALLACTTAQLVDDPVDCYKCGHGGDEHFPLCLDNPIQCKTGDVCRIQHGYKRTNHGPEISCKHQDDCQRDLQGHPIVCPAGGLLIDQGVCEICCQDDGCVANVTSVLHLEMMTSTNLFCPGQCDVHNLQHCIDTGRVCDELDFCQVKIDHAGTVVGSCKDDHSWDECLEDFADTPCPDNITDTSAYTHDAGKHCYHDCCTTNECLFKHFGIHMAGSVASRHPHNVQTSVVSTGTGLWNQLHGNCYDQFDKTLCNTLKNRHGICTNRLNISMCLDTCGVCSPVNSAACVDTNVGCPGRIMEDQNYCSSQQALVECPKSCNLCDKLVDSIITSILNGNQVSQPSVVHCEDLNDFSCDYLSKLCSDTFFGVLCPGRCNECAAAVHTSQAPLPITAVVG